MKLLLSGILALILFGGCVRTDVEGTQAAEDDLPIQIDTDVELSSDYYWYWDRKIPISPTDESFRLFRVENGTRIAGLDEGAVIPHPFSAQIDSTASVCGAVVNEATTRTLLSSGVEEFYSIPCFRDDAQVDIRITNLFHVILENASDAAYLDRLAAAFGVTVIGEDPVVPLLFTLSCDASSKGNALEMANLFHQTGRFEAVSPDFMGREPASSGDPYYLNQWNLNNTGQRAVSAGWDETYTGTPGIDIGYERVRSYLPATSDIVVAVIDTGVETTHPDLNLAASWDAVSMSSPCQIYQGNKHGTCCAGIIGAVADNGVGVAGIAPAKIMAISINLGKYAVNQDAVISRAIDFAVNNGADVISNSWGGGGFSEVIDSRLKNALTNGRAGKGCVLVFSSGNDGQNNPSYFPGATNPDYLCVGAMDPHGKRVVEHFQGAFGWGSNYGSSLDVVAPGTGIWTTDLAGSYTSMFNGTSAACPHVAGIAAIVLAFDPSLGFRQVNDLIESTAVKVGGYSYSVQSSRPNGTWHQEVGYGLVDVYEAVMSAAGPLEVSGVTFSQDTGYVRRSLSFSDITVSGQAKLDAHAFMDYMRFCSMQVKGNARIESVSKGSTMLSGVTLSESGKLSAAARDFEILPGFNAAKGTEVTLRTE